MLLKLSIPQQQSSLSPPFDARPGPTARWIDDLPSLDHTGNLERIHARLVRMNRAGLKPSVRLPATELLRSRAALESGMLEPRFPYPGLPMGERQRSVAELSKAVHLELAYAYKAAIVDLCRGGTNRQPMRLAIQRAVDSTTRLLIAHYGVYSHAPEGTWRELHRLRRFAQSLHLARDPVDDPAAQLRRPRSILECYKQAVLIGLCNPYQLDRQALRRADTFLERWAGAARIQRGQAAAQCRFELCDDCDAPAASRSRDAPAHGSATAQVLDTSPLVSVLNLQLTALRAGIQPDPDGLPAGFFDVRTPRLLHHLIVSWGLIPARSFSRSQAAGGQRMAVGLESIVRVLGASAADAAGHAHGTCRLLDEGAGGLGIEVADPGPARLRVGDAVCTGALDTHDAPTLGLIRWMRSASDQRIRLGLRKLGPGVCAATLAAVHADPDQALPPYPALRMPACAPLRQPRSVLAPLGVFELQRNLILECADGLFMIRAERLIERTGCLDWFEYRELDI